MQYLPSIFRPGGRDRVHNAEEGLSGSMLQFPPGQAQPPLQHAPTFTPEPNSQLATFRHLVGIHSTREFGALSNHERMLHAPHDSLHFEGRAVPNVGMYNRVCHREAQAKRGYKFASVLINSCLGLQVIVAAALTAMGAANTNHVSITAFGAVNTVLAAVLTYLKGSGLPNRIRWYENEWKKIREYIEQRERDFSRPNCPLDVAQVVEVVEAMYEEVKADIQTNTPESYISISDIRARSEAAKNPHIPKLQNMIGGTATAGRSKLEELELKYGHKATEFLEGLAHKEEERLKRMEGDIEYSKNKALAALQTEKDGIIRGARDWEKEMEDRGAAAAEKEIQHARAEAQSFGNSMQEAGGRHIERARSSFLQRGMDFAREVDTAKTGILQQGAAVSQNLNAASSAAVQQGREYQQDLEAKAARVAEVEREVEREAERTRLAAQRVGDTVQQAGDSFHRAGDSLQRIGKAVDDEIQPHRNH
ncbi:hypothetical protein NX059_002545 [Plenodomus lindquistii]|nr:hypothetical protein NX059_002545 [Plenodomus lindquistii]